MISEAPYTPDRSLTAKIRRRLTQWQTVQPLRAAPARTFVSFTFDDFPKSAADTGAEIIEAAGGKACFYACTGMTGTVTEVGEIFADTDIIALERAGHEIGAHTETHVDCARAPVDEILESIRVNLTRLKEMGYTAPVRQFAYPYGETRREVKRTLSPQFDAARGVLAGINNKGSDLMQLRALELDRNDWTIERAAAALNTAARKPTWIVFFTHDITEKPSPYGTTPNNLKRLARLARDSGADIVTPSQALKHMGAVQ